MNTAHNLSTAQLVFIFLAGVAFGVGITFALIALTSYRPRHKRTGVTSRIQAPVPLEDEQPAPWREVRLHERADESQPVRTFTPLITQQEVDEVFTASPRMKDLPTQAMSRESLPTNWRTIAPILPHNPVPPHLETMKAFYEYKYRSASPVV